MTRCRWFPSWQRILLAIGMVESRCHPGRGHLEPLIEAHLSLPEGTLVTCHPVEKDRPPPAGGLTGPVIRASGQNVSLAPRTARGSPPAPSETPRGVLWYCCPPALPRDQRRKGWSLTCSQGTPSQPRGTPTLPFSQVRSPGKHVSDEQWLVFFN